MSLQAAWYLGSFLCFPPLSAPCLSVIEDQPHTATAMFYQEYRAKSPWTEPSEMWAKINLASLELFMARIWVTVMTSDQHILCSFCRIHVLCLLTCHTVLSSHKVTVMSWYSSHQPPPGTDLSAHTHLHHFSHLLSLVQTCSFPRDVAMLASVKSSLPFLPSLSLSGSSTTWQFSPSFSNMSLTIIWLIWTVAPEAGDCHCTKTRSRATWL